MTKRYNFGGLSIDVTLEEPWGFRELLPEEMAVAERLARGEDIGVIPVPADKPEDLSLNEKLTGKFGIKPQRYMLDFSQYAPFEVVPDSSPVDFALTLSPEMPDWLVEAEKEKASWNRVVAVDEVPPFYYGYRLGGRTVYEFFPVLNVSAGLLVLEEGYRKGVYYPRPKIGPRATMFQVNTSLMIMYTFVGAMKGSLLLHSSVIRHKGEANLFFGVSGTGKSTHSRLWLTYVKDADLMNDDNPVIRFEDGRLVAYGTPWSGKTLCYRNVKAPVRAMVRLEQAPQNVISRLYLLEAYASVIAACSTIRWDSGVMDKIIPIVERIANEVPCWQLRCRPDEEAVKVCKAAIEG